MKNNRIKQVEHLIKLGFGIPDIAKMLHLTEQGAYYHLNMLYGKYGVTKQCELVARMHMGEDKYKAARANPNTPRLEAR